jgi:hypothetical protein
MRDPNFPDNLNIAPSLPPNGLPRDALASTNRHFGTSMQKDAIDRFGIAGRVWLVVRVLEHTNERDGVLINCCREAAYAINTYIESSSDWEFDPPFATASEHHTYLNILELGSGTGITSFVIARILSQRGDPYRVIMTDLPEVCPLLEENKDIYLTRDNSPSPERLSVVVRALTWGSLSDVDALFSSLQQDGQTLTHIICSDLVCTKFL